MNVCGALRVTPLLALLCLSPSLCQAQSRAPDGFTAVVERSQRLKVGDRIVLANVNTPRPFVTWPSGGGDPTQKVFEDDQLIVLIYVAQLTGSTETFYLNKKNRRFTLLEVSALQATIMDTEFQPTITYGHLK